MSSRTKLIDLTNSDMELSQDVSNPAVTPPEIINLIDDEDSEDLATTQVVPNEREQLEKVLTEGTAVANNQPNQDPIEDQFGAGWIGQAPNNGDDEFNDDDLLQATLDLEKQVMEPLRSPNTSLLVNRGSLTSTAVTQDALPKPWTKEYGVSAYSVELVIKNAQSEEPIRKGNMTSNDEFPMGKAPLSTSKFSAIASSGLREPFVREGNYTTNTGLGVMSLEYVSGLLGPKKPSTTVASHSKEINASMNVQEALGKENSPIMEQCLQNSHEAVTEEKQGPLKEETENLNSRHHLSKNTTSGLIPKRDLKCRSYKSFGKSGSKKKEIKGRRATHGTQNEHPAKEGSRKAKQPMVSSNPHGINNDAIDKFSEAIVAHIRPRINRFAQNTFTRMVDLAVACGADEDDFVETINNFDF